MTGKQKYQSKHDIVNNTANKRCSDELEKDRIYSQRIQHRIKMTTLVFIFVNSMGWYLNIVGYVSRY